MMKVLLIEPDKILGHVYERAIERLGRCSVTTVSGAQAAIMEADRQLPDVVIVELQLIEHSGIEFLYEFRSYPEWQSVPVIVHTIVPFSEFIDNWQLLQNELGVCAYLYKPQTSIKALLRSLKQYTPIAA